MKTIIPVLFVTLMLGACSYPNVRVETVDDRPRLSVSGAPLGSNLYIDSINMGKARHYNGKPDVLILEPGSHQLQIKNGENILHSQQIFLGRDTLKNVVVMVD